MKHLPKHLRPRWRYLAVELTAWPDVVLDRSDVQRAVWFAAGNLLGDPGSADADLRIVDYDYADGAGEALIRVRRGEVERARAALACVSEVRDHPVRVSVRGVSGTMRAARENYLGQTAGPSRENGVAFGDGTHSGVVRGNRVDVDAEGWVGVTRRDCQ
ncbi:Rpp14/Pop5 family protein [Halobacterium jilantaiense]|uniref:Ribonuclease P protein component 2 n=1 Tax=Halobacterium jilantaiense TaxID=355548 RepID=A0A1I0MJX5_9EURY|nr:Rpp14/Pop5 family protein [Halobacterium jilantaiense]SEV88344.1 ribonuclease P protein subunit Rpp14 [Halobacterium jilantaiense]